MASGTRMFMDPVPVLALPNLDVLLADDLELEALVDAPLAEHTAREGASVERWIRGGARAFASEGGLAMFRPLAWDSDHFGVRCADVTRIYGATDLLPHLIDHAARSSYRLLSARCRADRPGTIQALEAAGFRWVDTSVEIGVRLDGAPPPADPRVRPATPADAAALGEIARTFTRNRFHFDPRITTEQAEGVYRAWAENAACGRGEPLLVADLDGRPAGFCGYRPPGPPEPRDPADPFGVATLTLIVIAKEARGRGLFDALMDGVVRAVAGARHLITSTQVHNITSLRAFMRRGLRPYAARHVLHRWADAGN